MARYLMLWEYDAGRCPLDTKEKQGQWLALAELVKKQLKSGELKEWAHFAGESAGYVVIEGNEVDVLKIADTYVPYVKFTSKALLTIEQCENAWKSL